MEGGPVSMFPVGMPQIATPLNKQKSISYNPTTNQLVLLDSVSSYLITPLYNSSISCVQPQQFLYFHDYTCTYKQQITFKTCHGNGRSENTSLYLREKIKAIKTSNTLRKRMTDDIFVPSSDNLLETSMQEFSISRETYKLFVGTWNLGGIPAPYNLNLNELLDTQNTMADIYVLGFQEIVPLNAGNILVSENSNISMKWNSLIRAALNNRTITQDTVHKTEAGEMQRIYPLKTNYSINLEAKDYECLISKQMVGIYITVWVRTELHHYISHPSVSCVGCGILGKLGNKGSVSIRFCLHETSFCFVCSHLASGGKEGDERRRNTDVENILARTLFVDEPLQHLPRKILDHDRVIWLGDLNYRIYLPTATTRSLVKDKEWSILLENDQLKAEMSKGRIFEDWKEKEIQFPPTYKYNQNSDEYYGSNHKIKAKRERAPAWCDRIIWFGEGLKQIQYNRVESRLSDHRPVRAIFTAYVEVSRHSKEPGSSILSN